MPAVDLDSFVAESLDRPSIAAFMSEAAAAVGGGAKVLDAGSGLGPYRPLFAHAEYVSADWENSPHAGDVDVRASLLALPFADASFDEVLNTQVLEHVADPSASLAELHRILRPAGRLWLTAPLVWELHEEPFDFFRYTCHGLRHLLSEAGFTDVRIDPLTGYFRTLGQLLRNMGSATGRGGKGDTLALRALVAGAHRAGPLVGRLDRLDRRRALPLGYRCVARRANEG
ncbi:MAG TPA: methyltransferase domain-containing protein [Solirubrobacteraceae bacterium]|jgi:SAM-dependent methyltransferase|nr:methyltransferase domain-containing protein [Solirubrobacteraceae bacterium]